jgi:hypothetical protein
MIQIQHRRDTAANWTSNDPTLAAGEFGIETDTGNMKLGDGATAWTSLKYYIWRWKGIWDIGISYLINDMVTVDGSTYICTDANTGNQPPNASYWALIAEKGTQTYAVSYFNRLFI